nr:tyrosine-type recombinase/integrase [uncultured Arsenicibacter sp.]
MGRGLVRKEESAKSVGKAVSGYTVSRIIQYFAAGLPKSSNYPRHAKAYVLYCLDNGFLIDGFSFGRYTAELPPNRISPIRKFLLFYQQLGSPAITADRKETKVPPAANDLILRFMTDAKRLRGDQSKVTYTKALNSFFQFMDAEREVGKQAGLNGITVNQFVDWLKSADYSAFTVNLYLSAVKQLALWCIGKRAALNLNDEQVHGLRDINDVRGLAIERTFYKDSLEAVERKDLLDSVESARDRAMLGLLSLEGLRTVELTRLRLGDLDFTGNRIHVLGKGKNTRKPIKFFAACQAMVIRYLQETGHWPLDNKLATSPLFPDLKTHQIRYVVDKHLKNLGLKRQGMSAHSLRHTAGQLLLESGVSLEHVQQHLRHETMETTQFYTRKRTQKTYFDQMPE